MDDENEISIIKESTLMETNHNIDEVSFSLDLLKHINSGNGTLLQVD